MIIIAAVAVLVVLLVVAAVTLALMDPSDREQMFREKRRRLGGR